MSYDSKTIPGYTNSRPGIQVGTKMEGPVTRAADGSIQVDETGVNFLLQMGIEWVMIGSHQVPEHSAACYRALADKLGEYGLKIYRLANDELHNMPPVTLGLEGRDALIARYLQYIRDLGEAGIHYATYAHMGNGIWRDFERRPVRGGATAGGLNLESPHRGFWNGESYEGPLSHGRPYSEAEIWDNFRYFIDQVIPVAEDAGVRIGIHPDDPPAIAIGGVPRTLFGTFDGYKRALDYADSPNIGACLCVGCWLQGGGSAGSTPEEFIRHFLPQGRLFKLHLRNVTRPLASPGGFSETFPDAGYGDMAGVVRALHEGGFDGAVMNDHLIDMVGGHYSCEAYFTAYLKGLVDGIQAKPAT
ncbi:MAG: mannonate dehydratase [Bacillota bacterium]|nr:mannonate dehydratase [Bacillota bacterium]